MTKQTIEPMSDVAALRAALEGVALVVQRNDEREGRPTWVGLCAVAQVNDAEAFSVDPVRDIIAVI